MAMSPEMQARFESNRLKKLELERRMKLFFWLMIGLAAIMFCSSMMAGAISTRRPGQAGPETFYNAISAGFMQVLLAIATIVTAFFTAMKHRVTGIVYIGLCAVGILLILTGLNGTLAAANVLLLLVGAGLSVWGQLLCAQDFDLQQEPGYPLFSIEAFTPAKYEAPLNVIAARASASSAMDTVGAKQPAPVRLPEQQPVQAPPFQQPAPAPQQETAFFHNLPSGNAVRMPNEVRVSGGKEGALGFSDLTEGRQAAPAIPQPQLSENILLAQLSDEVHAVAQEALPQVRAEDLLMDMNAVPSHAVQQGDASMLPDPAEVRARMAAMKRAREEHPRP